MKKRIRGIAMRLLERGDSCEDVCVICRISEASLRQQAKEDPDLIDLVQRADSSAYARWILQDSSVHKRTTSGRKSRPCRHKRRSGRQAKEDASLSGSARESARSSRATILVSISD